MTAENKRPVSGKAPCPCGSGKKYKRCCGPRDAEAVGVERRQSYGKLSLIAAVCVAAVATAIAVYAAREKPPVYAPAPPPKPPRQPMAGPTPAPWTYNPATNQHWDPNHNHWHNGPPPAQNRTGDAVADVPGIPNPTPWQYDSATDRHFNPDHQHWHSGPPPADTGAPAEPAGPLPEDAGAVDVPETTPESDAPTAPESVEAAP